MKPKKPSTKGQLRTCKDKIRTIKHKNKKKKDKCELCPLINFAGKIAKTMKDLSSSHVYFIIQQAFDEDMAWDEVSDMLDEVITLTKDKI